MNLLKYSFLFFVAFLTTGCVSITKLPPQQSEKTKEYMQSADKYYQTAIVQYNEVNQLLHESVKDMEAVISLYWKMHAHILSIAKQEATAKQMTSSASDYTKYMKQAESAKRKREKIIDLKRGEARISYRKAVDLHDKAAEIADVRYVSYYTSSGSVFLNRDILKALEQKIEKNRARSNASQFTLQAMKYRDYVIAISSKRRALSPKDAGEIVVYRDKTFEAEKEALINNIKEIVHLKEEIKYRRKEFERIKKRL